MGLRTAIQFAFEGMFRVSDYAKKAGKATTTKLERSMIRWDNKLGGYIITLPWIKSSNVGQGFDVAFAPRPTDRFCPVKRMTSYLEWRDTVKRFPREAALFIRGDGKPVMEHQVNAILKKYAHCIGATQAQVSSHSLRTGGAFQMAEQGVGWDLIIQRGRWRSEKAEQLAMYYARFSAHHAELISGAFHSSSTAAVPLIPRF